MRLRGCAYALDGPPRYPPKIDLEASVLRRYLRTGAPTDAALQLHPHDRRQLWRLLERIVVRHRLADIHRDVQLPPCTVRGTAVCAPEDDAGMSPPDACTLAPVVRHHRRRCWRRHMAGTPAARGHTLQRASCRGASESADERGWPGVEGDTVWMVRSRSISHTHVFRPVRCGRWAGLGRGRGLVPSPQQPQVCDASHGHAR